MSVETRKKSVCVLKCVFVKCCRSPHIESSCVFIAVDVCVVNMNHDGSLQRVEVTSDNVQLGNRKRMKRKLWLEITQLEYT